MLLRLLLQFSSYMTVFLLQINSNTKYSNLPDVKDHCPCKDATFYLTNEEFPPFTDVTTLGLD